MSPATIASTACSKSLDGRVGAGFRFDVLPELEPAFEALGSGYDELGGVRGCVILGASLLGREFFQLIGPAVDGSDTRGELRGDALRRGRA